jgi:hypothetical protein
MSGPGGERHLFLVNSEQDAGYSKWWQAVHIPEVVARVPGIVSGQVFQLSPVKVAARATELRHYLAVYEIEGDPAAVVAALHEASDQGKLSPAPASGRLSSTAAVFDPVTEKLLSPGC